MLNKTRSGVILLKNSDTQEPKREETEHKKAHEEQKLVVT